MIIASNAITVDMKKRFDNTCDECGGHKMRQIGAGTEKIEEELATAFPSARIGKSRL